MHVAVIGAGAMGTYLGNTFCRGGHQVSVVDLPARVKQLQATEQLAVQYADGTESRVKPSLITADFSDVRSPDVVILATKSQDLPGIAQSIASILDEQTFIVTIQNGIPWWFMSGLDHGFGDARVSCLDPDRQLEKYIDPAKIVGCVAYPAVALDSDGVAQHVEGDRFPVGELDGSERDRTHELVSLFESSGFRSRVINDIRSEIWLKAWGALSINPVSALTGATMEEICTHPQSRNLIARMMHEAQQVAEAFGASMRHTVEHRIEGARKVGAHKTSMLQDREKGRPLELDGLMLAVLQLAEIAGKPAPAIEHVYACTALLNERLV